MYEEQVQNSSNSDGTFRDLEYDDLRDLPILDSVIRETLRLHPPIHSIMVGHLYLSLGWLFTSDHGYIIASSEARSHCTLNPRTKPHWQAEV